MRCSPRLRTAYLAVTLSVAACSLLWPGESPEAGTLEQDDVRSHAEQSFNRLPPPAGLVPPHGAQSTAYPPDQYLTGIGQGDMAKGSDVCRRVAELSARTEIAKQIRVLVKEHMVDRLRERNGREADQDIELTREEIVQEYLHGVMIVDRRIDDSTHTCSATAVMPKKPPPVPPMPSDSSPALAH